jgi:hypothetical protein
MNDAVLAWVTNGVPIPSPNLVVEFARWAVESPGSLVTTRTVFLSFSAPGTGRPCIYSPAFQCPNSTRGPGRAEEGVLGSP